MPGKVPLREGLFKEGPDGGRLLGSKCKSCGHIFYPKVKLCLECGHEELVEVELSRRGTLYSYTIGHQASGHFKPPYALGYVNLPEGVRVFAPLEIVGQRGFEVGMQMDLVVGKLWEEGDKEVIGYRFKPV